VDAIIFTSASNVNSFFEIMDRVSKDELQLDSITKVVSIGPFTSKVLRDRGIECFEAEEHTVRGALQIAKEAALLEDSTFNVITQIEKKADFLYSSVEKYIRDAEKDNKPELVKLWRTMKEDEQKHLKMLREHLVKEVRENKL
jgi:predicted Fe-Mo cluster-binding NifX family protein